MNMQLIRRGATGGFKCGTDRRTHNRKIEIKMEKKRLRKTPTGKEHMTWV